VPVAVAQGEFDKKLLIRLHEGGLKVLLRSRGLFQVRNQRLGRLANLHVEAESEREHGVQVAVDRGRALRANPGCDLVEEVQMITQFSKVPGDALHFLHKITSGSSGSGGVQGPSSTGLGGLSSLGLCGFSMPSVSLKLESINDERAAWNPERAV
jgi:hypothetical protein